MFRWLRRRERREHIKLLKQNELAAQYVLDFQNTALAMGNQNEELADTLEVAIFAIHTYQSDLKTYRAKPPERASEQLAINKNLRRLYDEIMLGRKAFAKQFGTVSERLENFDRKFVPNEGWENHFAHFGQSLEEMFKP